MVNLEKKGGLKHSRLHLENNHILLHSCLHTDTFLNNSWIVVTSAFKDGLTLIVANVSLL